jgi:hypothetical protein
MESRRGVLLVAAHSNARAEGSRKRLPLPIQDRMCSIVPKVTLADKWNCPP